MQQLNWIIQNKEWIFSGIGASFVIFLLSIWVKNTDSITKQTQSSGKNSINIQVGKDFNLNDSDSRHGNQ